MEQTVQRLQRELLAQQSDFSRRARDNCDQMQGAHAQLEDEACNLRINQAKIIHSQDHHIGELKSCTLQLLGKAAAKTEQGMISYSQYTRLLNQPTGAKSHEQ